MAEPSDSIRALTLTRLWLFSRYLYSVGDYRLWMPISHRGLGYTIAIVAPLWLVLYWLDVPIAEAGLTLHFVLPGLLVWWALRLVGEGAKPTEIITSWARLVWHIVHRGERVVPVRVASRATTPAGRPTRIRER